MKRYTVTLGASTTAGGKVISASSHGAINGVPIALENDGIFCPACKSNGKILCVGPRIPETWNGKQVALENDLCICGCFPSPRLLANQSLRSQVAGDGTAAGTPPTGDCAAQALSPAAKSYDLHFLVIDQADGSPVADWPYIIELAGGKHIEGRTDHTGRTSKVAASYADDAVIRVYAPEPAPINPFWDH